MLKLIKRQETRKPLLSRNAEGINYSMVDLWLKDSDKMQWGNTSFNKDEFLRQ